MPLSSPLPTATAWFRPSAHKHTHQAFFSCNFSYRGCQITHSKVPVPVGDTGLCRVQWFSAYKPENSLLWHWRLCRPWHKAFCSVAPCRAPAFASRILGCPWRVCHFLCLFLQTCSLFLSSCLPYSPAQVTAASQILYLQVPVSNVASSMKPSFLISWLQRCSPTSRITHLFSARCTWISRSSVHLYGS